MEKSDVLHEDLNSEEILLRSKIPNGLTTRKKGILEASGVRLALKKIGISDDELKELNVSAFKHNKKIAQLYENSIVKHPLPIKNLVTEYSLQLENRINPTLIPLAGPLPPPTGSLRVYPQNNWAHAILATEGLGDDYFTSTSRQSVNSNVLTNQFGVTINGLYGVTIPFFVVGQYFLVADDGLCEDKYVDFAISADLRISKSNFMGQSSVIYTQHFPLAHRRITNEAVKDTLATSFSITPGVVNQYDYMHQISYIFPFKVGEIITADLFFTLYSEVAGRGSIQKAFFDAGNGGLYSPYMDVFWLGTN